MFLNFIGRVYATIGSSASEYEKLWSGQCDATGFCGILSTEFDASAEVIDGVASFHVRNPMLYRSNT